MKFPAGFPKTMAIRGLHPGDRIITTETATAAAAFVAAADLDENEVRSRLAILMAFSEDHGATVRHWIVTDGEVLAA